MSRQYLALLAGIALVILVSGATLRRWLGGTTEAPTPAPTEVSALENLSERVDFQRRAEFLADRASMVAARVEYDVDAGATALRWGTGDTVLTTAVGHAVVIRILAASDTAPISLGRSVGARLRAPVTPAMQTQAYLLIVGRRRDGAMMSMEAASSGTTVSTTCGGITVDRFVLDIGLDDALAGAGLFDMDGRTRGMILRCEGGLAAVPVSSVGQLLAAAGSVNGRLLEIYGFTVTPLDERLSAYFHLDSGFIVTAVSLASAVASQLRVGDALMSIDSHTVAQLGDLAPLVASGDSAIHTAVRRRGTSTSTIRLAHQSTSATRRDELDIAVGAEESSRGIRITSVRHGSPAEAAGLVAGDRLVRVDNRPVRSEADARRLLVSMSAAPTFVVFEHGGIQHGILIGQ
ncbi:MAG: PDZ domain-containing protein [bacterium]